MKQCPKCGNVYNDKMQFCVEDQSELVERSRVDPQADTVQLTDIDQTVWMVEEHGIRDGPGKFSLSMSSDDIILGIFMRPPAGHPNILHPFLCTKRKRLTQTDTERFFEVVFAGTNVKGKYVGSYLATQEQRLVHVFEIDY